MSEIEQTTQNLNELAKTAVQDFLKTVSDTKAFVVSEAPQYFQQLIYFEYIKFGVAAAFLALFVFLFLVSWFLFSKAKDSSNEEFYGGCMAANCFGILGGGIATFITGMGAVKAFVAPKVVIMEQVQILIKSF